MGAGREGGGEAEPGLGGGGQGGSQRDPPREGLMGVGDIQPLLC